MYKKFIKALFILVSCLKCASTIRCFDCTSQNNSMCLDPSSYDDETLRKFMPVTTCSQGVHADGHHDFFCRKITQTIFHKHYEPEVRVTRACGWVRHHRECYKADNEDHLETVCQCFSDHCNSAPRLNTTILMIVTSLIWWTMKFIVN